MKSQICKKFEEYYWHDSKITSFKLIRRWEGVRMVEDFLIELSLLIDNDPAQYKWEKADLVFKDCMGLKIDLNLKGKLFCSDDISEAYCEEDSSLKQNIAFELGYPQRPDELLPKYLDPLAEYYFFKIALCSPGGDIQILAKDFELLVENQ